MSKSHYVQAIVTCLESANEKQAKLICTFVSNYMKKTELKNDFWADEAFAIVCEIYYILRRNPDEKFLRKALTLILAIEKVMYNGQQSNTESLCSPAGQRKTKHLHAFALSDYTLM